MNDMQQMIYLVGDRSGEEGPTDTGLQVTWHVQNLELLSIYYCQHKNENKNIKASKQTKNLPKALIC